MDTNPWYIITAALVTGSCAFFGAIAGQLFNRYTLRETWLLQKRSDAYSKFYTDLEFYESEVFRIDDSGVNESEGMKLKMFELEKLYASANIVRLYLSPETKKDFMDNLEKFIHYRFEHMSSLEEIANEFLNRSKLKDNITSIFEKSLEKIKWY